MASRADPSLPLAHFRGRGTMLEIGADDLRFTLEDTTGLLREMKIAEISVGDVVTLNERTEGWVAGLVMAALSMRGQKDIPAFITAFTGSQRYVMDYLVEEVLNKQSEEIRDFLLKTSILERLSGALCDAVTGNKGSQDILLNLEHSHLFIVPLDESRQWYRYEHLFADLLRHQCESVYGTEQVTSLHRLAWQWYQDNNLPDEAIHHALKTQDWDRAVVLITEYGEKKRQIGEFVTLLKWTQQIPEKVLISQPVLCLNHAGAMSMAGSLDTAESILKKLEKTVQSDDSLVGRIAASRAFLAWRRFDFPLAEELAKKALSLLPSSEIVQRDFMSLTLGLLYYIHGNYIEDEPIFTRAYEIAVRLKNYFGASSAFGGLMSIVRRKGKLRQVVEMDYQALDRFGPSPASMVPHFFLGTIYYEWNDLDGAAGHIQQAIELGKLIGTMQSRVLIHRFLACVRLAQGDHDGFVKALERADLEANAIAGQTTVHADLAAYHILFAIRQDDLATAEEWGIKLARYSDALSHEYRHFPLRLLIAQGNKSEALEELQVLYDEAVKSDMHGLMIEYRIYQALAAETEESALKFLSEALTMAEPEGYIRTFVDEGKLLAPLLEKAISRGIKPEYTGRLLRIIEEEQLRKQGRLKKPAGISPEPLSDRELEVLPLLAAGLSNRQIAERLVISVGTAKTHVHNILQKLEVSGRTKAIARARELKLL